ncbi:MAG TPA: hypothetical protein VNW46_12705 [Gemmatimonadaceae bacterium]|jgi:hypothetical protein|nr:hypothetical protein [Gemmatimonadaceae bacterium]
MRLTRSLATGLASLALLPAVASAQQQQGRLFQNSWFWGATAGVQTFWTNAVAHQQAPTFGLEWLITQKHTALYVSLEESIFHEKNVKFTNVGRQYKDSTLTTFSDFSYYPDYTPIKNARQLDLAFMVFPGNGPIRPYAGLGVAFNWVQGTKLPNVNPTQGQQICSACNPLYWYPDQYGTQHLDDYANFIDPMLILGIQAQVWRINVFGQGKVQGTNDNHIFNGQVIYELQAGIRFNVTSAFSKE